jgi:ribosomal-protein-alanine N-acetyltransferase
LGDLYENIPKADVFFYCPHPLTRDRALQNAAQAVSPTEIVWVIDPGDGIIGGYAWTRWGAGAPVSTFGICLAAAFKGQGMGEALIRRLTEIARQVGPKTLQLTVQKRNAAAVALYRKMGFEVVSEQLRQPDQEPEYVMALTVSL